MEDQIQLPQNRSLHLGHSLQQQVLGLWPTFDKDVSTLEIKFFNKLRLNDNQKYYLFLAFIKSNDICIMYIHKGYITHLFMDFLVTQI